jgi:hypothetical protein
MAGLMQALANRVIAGKEFFWRDRVEGFADVIITRNSLQMEQALGIALALSLLHGFLVGEKGRTLGEEHRKGRQPNVRHRIFGIVAGAAIGKGAHGLAQPRQVLRPGFEDRRAHAANLRSASGLRALR